MRLRVPWQAASRPCLPAPSRGSAKGQTSHSVTAFTLQRVGDLSLVRQAILHPTPNIGQNLIAEEVAFPKCFVQPKFRKNATMISESPCFTPRDTPSPAVTLRPQGHSLWLYFTFCLPARTYNMEQEICHRGHIPVVT